MIILVNFIHIVIVEYDRYRLTKINTELTDKVEFYEKVIDDFGINEFINYPEIYYNDNKAER